MKRIPTIEEMLDIIETVFNDLLDEGDTTQAKKIILKDGRELAQTLVASFEEEAGFSIYVTPVSNAIVVIYWSHGTQREYKKSVYYYNDYSSFESLLCGMMIDMMNE